MLDSG